MATLDLKLREYRSIAELDADYWDELLRDDDFYLSSKWLEVVEDSVHTPIRYAALTHSNRIEAALPTVIAESASPWVLGRPDGLLSEARNAKVDIPESLSVARIEPETLLPSLVCGGRHMGPTRIAGSRDVEHVDTLVTWASEFGVTAGVRSISFPFVDESDAELRAVLREHGFESHLSAEYAVLYLPEGGWHSYLESLPGKRRRRVLADGRQIQAAEVTSRIVPLSECDLADLGRLETQLMSKYNIEWTIGQTVQALEAAARRFGDNVSVVLSEIHGTTVGFVVLHRWRNSWYTRQTGFEYDLPTNPPLYFETMYYRPIREAEKLGIKAIFFGSGSEEAKRSRGCSLNRQSQYIKLLGS